MIGPLDLMDCDVLEPNACREDVIDSEKRRPARLDRPGALGPVAIVATSIRHPVSQPGSEPTVRRPGGSGVHVAEDDGRRSPAVEVSEDGFDLPRAIEHGSKAHHRVGEMHADHLDPHTFHVDPGCQPRSMSHLDLDHVDGMMRDHRSTGVVDVVTDDHAMCEPTLEHHGDVGADLLTDHDVGPFPLDHLGKGRHDRSTGVEVRSEHTHVRNGTGGTLPAWTSRSSKGRTSWRSGQPI